MTVSTEQSQARELPRFRGRYPGELLAMVARDRLAAFTAVARQGDVVQFSPVGRPVLLSHPEDIRRVLVTEQRKFAKGNGAEPPSAVRDSGGS